MGTTAIAWVQVRHPLTWETANGIADSVGGDLVKATYPAGWLSGLAELGPDHQAGERPSWTGAHRVGDTFYWLDGTPVDPAYFNSDDLDGWNATGVFPQYLARVGASLTDRYNDEVQQFLVEYHGNSIQGTAYEDWFLSGGFGAGMTIRAGGGDDHISDYNQPYRTGGTVFGDDGSDIINIYNTNSTVVDGRGFDDVWLSYGTIKATMDGQADRFETLNGGRISYADAKADLLISGWQVTSAEAGNDVISTGHVVGGSGNDTISWVDNITGGKGNDVLTPWKYAEGGDGNDTLIADSDYGRVELRGEAGVDTLIFMTNAEASGGAGADTFVFKGGQAKINDLSGGDRIDLSFLLDVTVDEAFAQGYLHTATAKGYTYLTIDYDGGGDDLVALATFKGVYANLSDFIVT